MKQYTVGLILVCGLMLSACGKGSALENRCVATYAPTEAKAAQIEPNVTTFDAAKVILGEPTGTTQLDASTYRYRLITLRDGIPNTVCTVVILDVTGQTVTAKGIAYSE